jgi:hypothetical protein
MLDSPEGVCAGQVLFEYPATSVLFSKPTSTPKAPLAYRRQADRSCCRFGRLRRGGVQPARRPVLREEPPMPVKCVTGGLLFRTGNDLDWHIREEHLQRETPPAKGAPVAAPAPVVGGTDQADGPPPPPAEGGYEPGATAGEPPARPWWRRLFGRRATGTPVGAGSQRGLARDPCPGRRSSSGSPPMWSWWRWDSTAVRTSARS